MVISLISRTQHILIIPELKHDFSHFDLVRMSPGWSKKKKKKKVDQVKYISDIPSEYD